MRILMPATFAVLFMAAPAFAGSISTVTCSGCPALKAKPKSETYHVEAIRPGTQKVEIREENGERRIYRTEAWMGGSPVTFVTKAPEETAKNVDVAVRTSALDASAADAAIGASMASSREFDPAGFALRTN